MAEVLLFHHAQGQTSGFLAFADELRRPGHTVYTPDLYDGHTFQSLDGPPNARASWPSHGLQGSRGDASRSRSAID